MLDLKNGSMLSRAISFCLIQRSKSGFSSVDFALLLISFIYLLIYFSFMNDSTIISKTFCFFTEIA